MQQLEQCKFLVEINDAEFEINSLFSPEVVWSCLPLFQFPSNGVGISIERDGNKQEVKKYNDSFVLQVIH